MSDKVLCPFCGAEMTHTDCYSYGMDGKRQYWFKCKCGANSPLSDSYESAVAVAIHRVEFETAKPSWISVEDRLPDNERPVITYDAAGFMWTEIYDYSRGKNLSLYERECWEGHLPGDSPVTHWMPMPEPPKEDAK